MKISFQKIKKTIQWLGYDLDDRGSIPAPGIPFSSPPDPHRLWGTPSFLSRGYWGLFLRVVKLITHLHLVPRLRMREATPSFPHTCLWRGA